MSQANNFKSANSKDDNLSNEIKIENEDLVVDINYDQRRVIIQHRYEWLNIFNDILLAIWFLVGSIFFFFSKLQTVGTCLFVLGSLHMLIGPLIRIVHKVHMKKYEGK